MKYRVLCRTGLRVSAVGLGCMMFGWRADAREAEKIVKSAVAGGINFIDTSASYGRGASEELLGSALKQLNVRGDVLIATKFGLASERAPGENATGNSRHNVIRQCEQSLKRLQIDHIDLLQIHQPSLEIPIEETLLALDQLVRQGKVRYIGSSNFAAWQIVEALWCADRRSLVPLSSEQVAFNLLDRRAETETFKIAGRYGLGIISYSPLAEGLLTGKYYADQPFPIDSRFAAATKGGNYRSRMTAAVMRIVESVSDIAREHKVSPAGLAIAWVLRHPQVSTVLLGPSANNQMEELLLAVDIELDPQVIETIGRLPEFSSNLSSVGASDFARQSGIISNLR
jgi:aryl-alcohol dehydrogenase-like predicted oxidoreductase